MLCERLNTRMDPRLHRGGVTTASATQPLALHVKLLSRVFAEYRKLWVVTRKPKTIRMLRAYDPDEQEVGSIVVV